MKRATTAGLLIALCGAAAAPLPVYVLDPDHSFVQFEVMHFGTSTSRGRIGPIEGAVEFDRQQRRGRVALRIPVASLDTGLPVFDARLKRDDLLAADAYPDAYFTAADFRFDGERLVEVRGELIVRGIGHLLALRALRFACRQGDSGGEICGGDFEGIVNRSEYGASFGLPFIADRVRLLVSVEGLRR